jgi:hypothetical protein
MTDLLIAVVGLSAVILLVIMMKKRKKACLTGRCDGCPSAGSCSFKGFEKKD